MDLYRLLRGLDRSAKATAWGVLGAILGYLLGSFLARFHVSALLGQGELATLGYAITAAVYTLTSRSNAGISRCLGFAEIMFAEGKVSAREYNSMRGKCLQRGGLVGKES